MKSFVLILTVFYLIGCTDQSVPRALREDIDSISVKWIPDSREAVGTITVSESEQGVPVLAGETDLPGLKEEITDYLQKRKIRYIDKLVLLPDSSVDGKTWGLVLVSVGNIKAEPSHSSELVSQVVMGTPLRLLKRKGSWILIQAPDHYIGWINDSSVSEMTSEEIDEWKKSDRLIYLGKSGEIMSDIASGNVISDIVAGSILIKSGQGIGFYSVVLPGGREGIIPGNETVDFNDWSLKAYPVAEKMIAFARSMNGYPYLWGGTSSKAVDCSGFTRTIYFMAGIILSRDASQQFLHGIKVDVSSSINALMPGDLVFFGYTNREGKERIIHTGMYIGDTEVIHSSGMVGINSLDSTRANYSSYLGKGLRGARRIIGAPAGKGTEPVAQSGWYILK